MASPESERIREYYESQASPWTRWSAGRNYAVEERRRILARIITAQFAAIEGLRICDIGCGAGGDLTFWSGMGVPQSNLAGTELLPDRAREAKERLPDADIRKVTGFDLPFADGEFDVTTASLVFSSILDSQSRRQLFREMRRVTRDAGLTIIYDMRITKPSNPSVARFTPALLGKSNRPVAEHRATPFLPALALFLSAPSFVYRPLVALLPRTHAIWVWKGAS